MNKNKIFQLFKKIDSFYPIFVFSIGYLSILFIVLRLNTISSILFKFSFILIFSWIGIRFVMHLFNSRKEKIRININKLLSSEFLIFFIFFFSIISMFVSSNFRIHSFSFFNQFICFISCIFLFYLCSTTTISKNTFNYFIVFNAISIILIFILFINGYSRTWNNVTKWYDLNLNFDNPNPAGEFLAISLVYSIFGIIKTKNIIMRLTSFFSGVFGFVLLIFTSSRNPFVAAIVAMLFVFVFLFFRKENIKSKIKKNNFSLVVVLFPLFYVVFLVVIISISLISGVGVFIFEKYEFLGRYYLWWEYLQSFQQSFFVGIYYVVGTTGAISSFVNSHLSTLILFGPIAYLFFSIFLYRVYSCVFNRFYKNRFDFCLYVSSSIFILFLGLNEGGVFVGAGGIFILGIFVILLSSRSEESRKAISSEQVDYLIEI